MIYILARTRPLASKHAIVHNLEEWQYVHSVKDIKGIEDSLVIVLDGWAKRNCFLMEMMMKTQLAVVSTLSTNVVVYP